MDNQETELESGRTPAPCSSNLARRTRRAEHRLDDRRGFLPHCLADWYREAAQARGIDIGKDAARERIYGEPFAAWKARHQQEATPEQLAAFAAAQREHPA